MKYILLLLLLVNTQAFALKKASMFFDAYILWDKELYIKLSPSRLEHSKDLNIFGSFSLKRDRFRSIELRNRSIKYPRYEVLLAQKGTTVYILDLSTEKLIGQFELPLRGAPRFIKIEPNDESLTNLRYHFRRLPKKGYKGRPGPLIEKIFVYKNGQYSEHKKDKSIPFDAHKQEILLEVERSEEVLERRFKRLLSLLEQTSLHDDEDHNTLLLESLQENHKSWFDYRYSFCRTQVLFEVYPSLSRLYTEVMNTCIIELNEERTSYLYNLFKEAK